MRFGIIQKIVSTGRFEKKKEIRKTRKISRRLRKPLYKRTRLSNVPATMQILLNIFGIYLE